MLKYFHSLKEHDGLSVEAHSALVPASAHVLLELVVLRVYVSTCHAFQGIIYAEHAFSYPEACYAGGQYGS